jgi:hypothetical protein
MVKKNIVMYNRVLYSLATLLILSWSFMFVFAYGGNKPSVMGHNIGEIAPPEGCSGGDVLKWNGNEWVCSEDLTGGDSGDITDDYAWVGDKWVSNGKVIECTHVDGGSTFHFMARVNNGRIQVRRYNTGGSWGEYDSGWVNGLHAGKSSSWETRIVTSVDVYEVCSGYDCTKTTSNPHVAGWFMDERVCFEEW